MGYDIGCDPTLLINIKKLNMAGWNSYSKIPYTPKIQVGLYELEDVYAESIEIVDNIIQGLQLNAKRN